MIEFAAHLSSAAEKESDSGTPLKCEIATNLTGEFLWDAAQGHLHSFELSGPVTMSATGEREIDVKGQTLPMKLHFVLAGEIKKSARFE